MNLLDPHEKLMVADKIKKFTPCGWFKQERIIAITTENIYNIKVDSVKRRIQISSLAGISKNMIGGKNEIIYHVAGEYDYRYFAEVRRQEFIDAAKLAYAVKQQNNLPVYGIQ
jgi:hypothetical protein